jgi:hypothetical protein
MVVVLVVMDIILVVLLLVLMEQVEDHLTYLVIKVQLLLSLLMISVQD